MIRPDWLSYDVLAAEALRARTYLCVGVQEGNCLEHVLNANGSIKRLALCDTWGPHDGGTNRGSHDHIQALLERLGWSGEVVWLDGDSTKMIPTLPNSRDWDLSYVDGGHSEECAYADMVNVWPRTRLAMVVHDFRFPSVGEAVWRFLDWTSGIKNVQIAPKGTGTLVVYRD